MDELVERARTGDREAFAALVQLTSDRMYAIATRILRDGDLAEDALQSALITAWKSLPGLRDPARFEAWLRRLLVHACYAAARRRQSRTSRIRVLPLEGPVGPDGLLSVVDRDALDRAFRRLSIEQRAVFVLHHHLGLALTEIAETTGIPAVFKNPQTFVDPCSKQEERVPYVPGADAFLEHFRTTDAFEVGKATEMTIDGHRVVHVDVTGKSNYARCPDGPFDQYTPKNCECHFSVGPGGSDSMYLVEVGEDTFLFIVSPFGNGSEAAVMNSLELPAALPSE